MEESGPDHSKTFQVTVRVGKTSSKIAQGLSKRRAEEAAAAEWLRANANAFLESKILQQASTQNRQTPQKAAILDEEADGKTLRALRRFNLDQSQASRLTRAMMHPSYGLS